jgi:protoheme IX farnesyltransferase
VSDATALFEAAGAQAPADPAILPMSVPGDFLALLKPRVMSLVVFSAIAAMLMAPGHLHPILFFTAVLCIAVGAGASGAINMWYDRDIDAIMTRTSKRPLPAGRLAPAEALSFGVILAGGSVIVMGLALNVVAAALLALAIGFYVFIYTVWLKRRTQQNIVIGGAAGAFPPMIGWAAMSGEVSLASIVLFAIIFAWTPPHFWALALYRSDDYGRAGIPMMPNVAGHKETKRQMLLYTLLLVPLSLAPFFMGIVGSLYGVVASLLGLIFIACAVRVLIDHTGSDKPAKQMFAYSILYLFLLFALMMVDRTAGALA